MSRKDRRAVTIVDVTPDQVRWLRAQARGGSLADALRRTIEAQRLEADLHVPLSPLDARPLPVQLPARLRRRVSQTARALGCGEADVLRAALHWAMSHDCESNR